MSSTHGHSSASLSTHLFPNFSVPPYLPVLRPPSSSVNSGTAGGEHDAGAAAVAAGASAAPLTTTVPSLSQSLALTPTPEMSLNVNMAGTDRNFLILCMPNTNIRDVMRRIEDQYARLFRESIQLTFLTNDAGSVIDEDFVAAKAFANGARVKAHTASLIAANSGQKDNAVSMDNHSSTHLNRRTRPKAKDPNAPKRPRNAFMRFATKRRDQIPEGAPRGPNLMRLLGQEWAAMSELQKEPYQMESRAELAKYAAAKNEYIKTLPPVPTPNEQPKRVIKRLLETHGYDVNDRSQKCIDHVLREFNEIKQSRRTRKWLIKQLDAIAQKQLIDSLSLSHS
eukprot:m.95472 g.95472  ORF g.95472 m.95472 type:complete len:338 (+) comp10107_c0_seq2:38-1051(+)